MVIKSPPVSFDIGLTVNRQGRPALDCQFSVPRVLGTVASLTADMSVSSFIAHSFSLGYVLPLGSSWRFTADVVKQVNDFHASSSFSEAVEGVGLGWSNGRHRFGLDAHLRDIYPLISGPTFVASEQIRRVPLRSIKTAFTYTYSLDHIVRESGHIVHGHAFGLRTELAGLFGDVEMIKINSHLSLHRRIWKGLIWHGRIGGGWKQSSPIQDRFFLGGTNEETFAFRGFANRSIGPSAKRQCFIDSPSGASMDYLGADAFSVIDSVLSFPVYMNIKGLLFLQGGSLAGRRLAAGAGIRVPIGSVGSVELTFGAPLISAPTDTSQCMQIGIRMSK